MLQEQEAELQKVKFDQIYVRPAGPYTGRLIFASGKYSWLLYFTEKLAREARLEGERQGLNSGNLPSRSYPFKVTLPL